MWYELWPFAGIMFAMFVLPNYCHAGVNMLFNKGHVHARNLPRNQWDFVGYCRDKRITGSYYLPQGLETIPDEK